MPWEYVLPAGLVRDGAGDPALEERYEVTWRDGEGDPHRFYWVQVSALRLERFVADALTLLPDEVHAVLEVRHEAPEADAAPADPDAPAQDRYAGGPVTKDRLLRIWARHGAALVHDGLVGFGAYDPESPLEVFLDDHKLVSLFAGDGEDPFEELLARHAIPEGRTFATILDAEHDHLPLTELPRRGHCRKRAWPRRRGNDVRWFAAEIRKALGLRLQRE